MIYREKEISLKSALLFTGVLFLLLASPLIFDPAMIDLRRVEGAYASEVRELSVFPPLLKIHGVPASGTESFPLYPLLVKGLVFCGASLEGALRLVPVLCLGFLAALVFFCCYTAAGTTAAVTGACVVLTTFISADKMFEGNPVLLGTVGVFSAWLLWFYFGAWRNRWAPAWISTGLVAGLTFYAMGPWGVLAIVFPMLFLRRPLSVRTKPRGAGFAAGAVLLLAFILLWGMPRWHAGAGGAFNNVYTEQADYLEYFGQLVFFPVDALLHLMPWSIFLWAPFCAALIPLDRNPLLSKYMRSLFAALFCLLWISPATRSRDLILLIPLLGVLIGLNYWIVVRRYGGQLLSAVKLAGFILLLAGAAVLTVRTVPQAGTLFAFLPGGIPSEAGSGAVYVLGIVYLSGGFLLAGVALALAAGKNARVWMLTALVFASFMLFWTGLVLPRRAADRERRTVGFTFRKALGENPSEMTVYKSSNLPDLYAECHYMGANVILSDGPANLPQEEKTIYMLASELPSVPERIWTKMTELTYKGNRLILWKGKLRMDDENELCDEK